MNDGLFPFLPPSAHQVHSDILVQFKLEKGVGDVRQDDFAMLFLTTKKKAEGCCLSNCSKAALCSYNTKHINKDLQVIPWYRGTSTWRSYFLIPAYHQFSLSLSRNKVRFVWKACTDKSVHQFKRVY